MIKQWEISKTLNITMVIQMVLLAGLIFNSWKDVEYQLDILKKDTAKIIETQNNICDLQKQEELKFVTLECRIQSLEQKINKSRKN